MNCTCRYGDDEEPAEYESEAEEGNVIDDLFNKNKGRRKKGSGVNVQEAVQSFLAQMDAAAQVS